MVLCFVGRGPLCFKLSMHITFSRLCYNVGLYTLDIIFSTTKLTIANNTLRTREPLDLARFNIIIIIILMTSYGQKPNSQKEKRKKTKQNN